MRTEKIAGWTVHLAGGTDRAGGGDGPMVVLLHGYGAPGTDLVPIWRQLQVPNDVRFAFPEAPLELDARSLGLPPGYVPRAFWDIDMLGLQTALQQGRFEELRRHEPRGLDAARDGLEAVLDALQHDYAVPPARLILGGFSQGAMLSCDYAFRSGAKLRGLVVLSGMVLCEDTWIERLPDCEGLQVFQSHGRTDPLLPIALGERLRELMLDAGLEVEWVAFGGGHGIGGDALDRLGGFIRRELGGAA